MWLVVGAYLIWGCRPRFRLLGLAVMPLAAVLFIVSRVGGGTRAGGQAHYSNVFLVLHVFDIWLSGANHTLYDELLSIYASPVGRVGEMLLGAALLYHALNGLRIVIMDFWPAMTRWHRQMWYVSWVVFVAVGLPVAFVILKPIWGG